MKVHTPYNFEFWRLPENISRSEVEKAFNDGIKNLNGIFLAGPCIREKHYGLFSNWRDDAIRIFKEHGFEGDIFSPEPFCKNGYENQIMWEEFHLTQAKVVMFWIPRQLDINPAFTSNVEFGEWMKSGKVVLGYPSRAAKMGYLKFKADRYKIPVTDMLEPTVIEAIHKFNQLTKKKHADISS